MKRVASKETTRQESGERSYINYLKCKFRGIKVFILVRDSKFHYEVEWEVANFSVRG